MSKNFILIVEVIKQLIQIKNKMTCHFVTWFFYGRRLHIKYKHLVVRKNIKVLTNSEISGKELKAPLFTASSHNILVGYSAVVA